MPINKGNNKITGLRTILQLGKVKTHKYINRQNQSTTGKLWKPQWPWLGTGISKKWWVESDSKAPNLPLSLRLKGSGCHNNSIYNNMISYSYRNLYYLTLQSFDLELILWRLFQESVVHTKLDICKDILMDKGDGLVYGCMNCLKEMGMVNRASVCFIITRTSYALLHGISFPLDQHL